MTRLIVVLTLLTCCASIALAEGVSTITLKRFARVPIDEPVLLEDIADLVGPHALALAWVEVEHDPRAQVPLSAHAAAHTAARAHTRERAPTTVDTRTFEVSAEQVRERLEKAGSVSWVDVVLRGSACVVMPIDADRIFQKLDTPAEELIAADLIVGDEAATGTVRAAVRRYLVGLLDVDADDLRVGFDDRDSDLLDLETASRRVEVRAVGRSAKMPLDVVLYGGNRIVAEGTVRVDIEVRESVLVARERIRRGEILVSDSFVVEERWLGVDAGAADPIEAIGLEARAEIAAGAVVLARLVEEPIAIERGERVAVRCLAGGVVIRTEAYATESGHKGDVITMRLVGKSRRDPGFPARVEGPGLVVAEAIDTMRGAR